VQTSPFLTNPRKGNRHPPPLHPLENRNSAPEIVVTSTGSPQSGPSGPGGLFCQQPQPQATSTLSSRRLHHGGLEERIQRAKAKVQVDGGRRQPFHSLNDPAHSFSKAERISTPGIGLFRLRRVLVLPDGLQRPPGDAPAYRPRFYSHYLLSAKFSTPRFLQVLPPPPPCFTKTAAPN